MRTIQSPSPAQTIRLPSCAQILQRPGLKSAASSGLFPHELFQYRPNEIKTLNNKRKELEGGGAGAMWEVSLSIDYTSFSTRCEDTGLHRSSIPRLLHLVPTAVCPL
ncbi:hypothetical protein GDO81_018175 [Engystomops pustulosus]|uniref:Uncharacterized protein n=1 Tax=Engystomops pustulosus TaxID=76066 RepID=A0AAV7AA19_ENGPU|nr:hypothetical protein GDO81_018175 [Engystomops pustulosus]